MRLLIHALNFAPEPTGCGKYSGEMAAWFAERGHDVHVIAGPPHYPNWILEEEYRGRGFFKESWKGVTVHRTPLYVPPAAGVTPRTRILMETSFTAGALAHWLPALMSRRFDACIAVCPPLQAGVLPALYQFLRGVPWVFHVQDLQVDAATRLGMLARNGRAVSWTRLLPMIELTLLRAGARVSTISEAMRQRIIEKGVDPERVWLVPNWSSLSGTLPEQANNAFRRKLGAGRDSVVVMYAGAMGEKQGLEQMLDLADRLVDRRNLIFVMVGNGAAGARIRAVARSRRMTNLHFHPVQPEAVLGEVISAADLHLVLQREEAADLVLPSKVTNILAAGRPFVATASRSTELGRVAEYSGAGVCVTGIEELTATVDSLVDDVHRRGEMGARGRRYAEQHLSKASILSKFDERLRTLIEETYPLPSSTAGQ